MTQSNDPSKVYWHSTAIYDRERGAKRDRSALGTWVEPSRTLPVFHRCDVLVVGGGPSGTAAAIAAARMGAEVTLLERYNHLGGLSTGGLVLWIDRMTDWEGNLVIRGFAEELFDRLPKEAVFGPPRKLWGSKDPALQEYWFNRASAFHGVVTWAPTIDPEHLKNLSQDLILAEKVKLLYHACASVPIVENGAVRGIVFDSKEGRMALMARVVVDATGDGDLFSRAGGEFDNDIDSGDIHHCVNTAWLWGGVDMEEWLAFKAGQPEAYAKFLEGGRAKVGMFERPHVSWRSDIALFMGPRQSGFSAVDVEDMTEVEVRSRRAMVAHLAYYKKNAPGFKDAYMIMSAPQLGVRHSRRLKGVSAIRRAQWPSGTALPDEVGVSPSLSPQFPVISIPYGALVPERLNGLLASGRHIACDANSHSFMREIPQCWQTGQAAGVAAALSVARGVEPRAVDITELQSALRKQGVYLRTTLGVRKETLAFPG
jgi:hypothetical protein